MNNLFANNKIKLIAIALLIISISLTTWYILHPKGLGKDFVSGNGRIEASEIDIATEFSGKLIKILVNEGEIVTKDQILAQMQTDILQAQLEEAIAKYKQTIKTIDIATAQIEVAQNNLVAAKSTAEQREAEINLAKKHLKRSQSLAKAKVIPTQTLDNDQASFDGALAAFNAAKAQIAANEASVKAAQANFNGAISTAKAYAANIKKIEIEINHTTLKSPCDAKVQYKIAQPGEVLASGGKVLNLIDLHDIYMTFFLPETIVGRIPIGTEVRILLDAMPNYTLPAKISFISSTAQFTPKTVETASERQKLMFKVKAKINQELINNNLNQVKTGVPGMAYIKLNKNANWPKMLATVKK